MEKSTTKTVILLVNLGSPNQLTTSAIRKFLRKFLLDKRVVNLPRLFWLPILFGIILPFRAKKLLTQYAKVWSNGLSPLIYYTQMQSNKLSERLSHDIVVEHAFCYADPEISDVLARLYRKLPIQKLIVLPLYPQFSSTTTMPVFDQIQCYYKDKFIMPHLIFINQFFNHPLYIKALVDKIKQYWQNNERSEKLILSYHSLPQKIINNGDSYYRECLETSNLIAKELNLNSNDYVVTFQSRFGRQKWLTPATIDVISDCAKNNIKSLDIICPGFVSDCLETLDEINIINRQVFLANGGKRYNYIACLNDEESFIDIIDNLVKDYI